MTPLAGARVALVGAGVLGLATAAELTRRGARCILIDPARPGDNASGVSAGMLAPAFESALDPLTAGCFALLREARDLWPAFLQAHPRTRVWREGALWTGGDAAALDAVVETLRDEGAQFERLEAHAAASLQPGLRPGAAGAVFTPEDWRLEPAAVLQALQAEITRAGGRLLAADALRVEQRSVHTAVERIEADAVVLCAGYEAARFATAAPELAILHPVKGQRLRYPGAGPGSGPVVRSAAGYVVPLQGGALVGATMEPGRDDRLLTREAGAALHAAAAELFPALAGLRGEAAAGVRAETPDGLPLVGRSACGVLLATGARRNGWLLAPLIAGMVADELAGGAPGEASGRWREALRPDRFASPA